MCGKVAYIINALILCVLFVLMGGCGSSHFRYQEGVVWNTSYHIVYDSEHDYADALLSEMQDVDDNLSPFNKRSVVSRLNLSAGVRLTPKLRDVLAKSVIVWRESGGYFDPSAAPLINMYGFGAKQGSIPDERAIKEVLSLVGMDKVTLTADSVIKRDARMEFNFSAIAKGYGCDCVADVLKCGGVSNYMVEIGGEVVVAGHNPQGGKWRISVDKPVENDSAVLHESQLILAITDCAVATSGNYRNYRSREGKRIGHIVNPLTGQPQSTQVASVTVVADDCMTADAYATACMAMPQQEMLKMIERLNLTVFVIYKDGSTWMTPSFRKLVVTG